MQHDGEPGQLRARGNILDDIKASGKLRKKQAGLHQTQKSEENVRGRDSLFLGNQEPFTILHTAGLLGHSGVQGELATPRSSIDVKV
jgi:hypothetical protein